MSSESSVSTWIGQLRIGQSDAAQKLWERYFEQLVRRARQHLQRRGAPRAAADEEDVALNAFDSFYRGVEQGRFPRLSDRQDLWQVLVMISARKAGNLAKHSRAAKRGGGNVVNTTDVVTAPDEDDLLAQVVGKEPTPAFIAQVTDECRILMDRLDSEELRRLALEKLEGYTNEEIAARLDCTIRTVERKLRRIRAIWDHEADDSEETK